VTLRDTDPAQPVPPPAGFINDAPAEPAGGRLVVKYQVVICFSTMPGTVNRIGKQRTPTIAAQEPESPPRASPRRGGGFDAPA
jgi:hypothetical protein